MKKLFHMDQTVYDIINAIPQSKRIFEEIGFKLDEANLAMSKKITLKMALAMKKVTAEVFEEKLRSALEEGTENQEKLRLQGVLPCPVKIPLLEAYSAWAEENDMNDKVDYELQAASMGLDWLVDAIDGKDNDDAIADVFISAGFDLFFDKNLIGKFKDKGVFKDITGFDRFNKDFDNEEMSLKDPDGHYSIIAVVPAVFLVNTDELNGRTAPRTWEDLLKPEFENSVSLPVGDFDLFNAILINIYKKYGEEGVRKLGKCMMMDMHPAEMVKSHRKPQRPAVTIMPYFFTKMTKNGGPMEAVWPADGAIISPIFLLSKASKSEEVKPLVDFFASQELAEILSYNGKFPSTRPGFDNMLSPDQKYMWIGWDFIKENDINQIIKTCEKLFDEGRQ
ncbi:ABC transporter substrate-binding protein [Vallitalea okinawensis]|uniref:ABC transporter substrate-binding protein n=1 Tax=Vallitalea okinawensis TaxID=2078660 RepID=UPI000CFD6F9B|nr:ABC transporter substrate-binding protein [Vallitalea okinawensis]